MLKFNCHIKGVSPLLFNRFPDEDNADDKSKRKTANPSKDEQVELSLYRNSKKKIYQPADHILGSMLKAAPSFKLEGKKTFKDVVKAGVFVEPLEIIHTNQSYTTDWRSVVNPSTRGRRMKGRARMEKWELKFELVCIDPRARSQDIKDILSYAGSYCGIGDYRPRYGRFEVVSMTEVK